MFQAVCAGFDEYSGRLSARHDAPGLLDHLDAVQEMLALLMGRIQIQRLFRGRDRILRATDEQLGLGKPVEDLGRGFVAERCEGEALDGVVGTPQGHQRHSFGVEHLLRLVPRRVAIGQNVQGRQGPFGLRNSR